MTYPWIRVNEYRQQTLLGYCSPRTPQLSMLPLWQTQLHTSNVWYIHNETHNEHIQRILIMVKLVIEDRKIKLLRVLHLYIATYVNYKWVNIMITYCRALQNDGLVLISVIWMSIVHNNRQQRQLHVDGIFCWTRCGRATPYGDNDLGPYWLRLDAITQNQYYLFINGVPWHSHESNFTVSA